MAKNDMIANHKKGFFNSTVGNGIRGGLLGGALFGGLAALAVVATGGLALPVLAAAAVPIGMAAAGGAAIFGGANALGGGVRWGAETLGGIVGLNRKQRGGQQMGYEGQEQAPKQGMGMSEVIGTAVAALLTGKSIKDAFGSKGRGEEREEHAPPAGPVYGGQSNGLPREPRMSDLLTSKLDENGKLSLSNQDLADPNMRRDLEAFSKDAQRHTRELHKAAKGGRNPAALERLEQLNELANTPISHDAAENRFTFEAASLRNQNLPNHLSSLGENAARTNEANLRARYETAINQSKDLQSGNVGLNFGQQPAQEAQVVQTQQPAQEMPAFRPDTPAMESLRNNLADRAQETAARRSASPETSGLEVVTQPSGRQGLSDEARREALGVAGVLLGSGAERKGQVNVAHAGSASAPQQTGDRSRSQ